MQNEGFLKVLPNNFTNISWTLSQRFWTRCFSEDSIRLCASCTIIKLVLIFWNSIWVPEFKSDGYQKQFSGLDFDFLENFHKTKKAAKLNKLGSTGVKILFVNPQGGNLSKLVKVGAWLSVSIHKTPFAFSRFYASGI